MKNFVKNKIISTRIKQVKQKYKNIFMSLDLDFEGYCALKKAEKQEIDGIK